MNTRASGNRSAQTTEPTVKRQKKEGPKKMQRPATSQVNKGVKCVGRGAKVVGRGGRGAMQQTQEREETQDSNTLQEDDNSLWRNLNSFKEFQNYFKEADIQRVLYTIACAVKKLDPTLAVESAVEGIVFLDEETRVKQNIQIMEVKNKNIKKFFYHTCTNNSGTLFTTKQLNDILRAHMEFKEGKDHICRTLEGCKKGPNGMCTVKGRSDHVMNHIRGLLGYAYKCFYCHRLGHDFSKSNTQHFKEHFKKQHWDIGFGEAPVTKKSKKSKERKPKPITREFVSDDESSDDDAADTT